MAYLLEGQVIEICTCNVICPCWVGGEPDMGYCHGVLAYHVEKGNVNGTDVSGHTLAGAAIIPGVALEGGWVLRMYVDDAASDAQADALVAAFSGKHGGPLADIAKMVKEVTAVERAPIQFELTDDSGKLVIGDAVDAGMTPLRGATGNYTSLRDAVFSTIPGAPALVGKSTRYRVQIPEFQEDLEGHSAVWGPFCFEG